MTLPEAAHGVTQRLRLPTGKDIDVKIPAGITNGQQIRVRGQGMAGKRRRRRADHRHGRAASIFTLDGADVRLDLPDHALRGGAWRQGSRAHPRQSRLRITIPAWTYERRTFRLKGKGFPAKAGRGDLLATARIVLPDQQRSSTLRR